MKVQINIFDESHRSGNKNWQRSNHSNRLKQNDNRPNRQLQRTHNSAHIQESSIWDKMTNTVMAVVTDVFDSPVKTKYKEFLPYDLRRK